MKWGCDKEDCTNEATKCVHGRRAPTKGKNGEPINRDIDPADGAFIQSVLRDGEGDQILKFACEEHVDILREQQNVWAEDPLVLSFGIWTLKDRKQT